MSEQSPDALIGQTLDGRYRIEDFLTEGGMGNLFKATQVQLERTVALKIFKEPSYRVEEFKKRFFLEASLCGRLTHPNIVRIFDYGCHGEDTFYIAMEYLEGLSLQQLLQSKLRLKPPLAITILKEICAGLIDAHNAGLVHRDLKPANIFLVPNPMGGYFVKILDFGVVKQLNDDHDLSQANSTMGSPLYMSPEQIRNENLDVRSDLYSLGVIMYQMITGHLPFRARSPIKLLRMHMSQQPPAFRESNPNLKPLPDLERFTMKALAKEAEDRQQDVREMFKNLETLLRKEESLAEDTDVSLWSMDSFAPVDPIEQNSTREMQNLLSHTHSFHGQVAAGDNTISITRSFQKAVTTQEQTPSITSHSFNSNISSFEMTSEEVVGYTGYIDFDCPFCFALYERLHRWELLDSIDWCMIEHSGHLLDGPFDLNQEEKLAREVMELHHRAADVEVLLPLQRCRSGLATRLVAHVQAEAPLKTNALRLALFRALWQEGKDLSDRELSKRILREQGLSLHFLDLCEEGSSHLSKWQKAWESGNFDQSIPVLTHPGTERALIGLADEDTLISFLQGDHVRVIDNAVCHYQQKPSILVCGWMSQMWPFISKFRSSCEILQAPDAKRAAEHLSELGVPNLLIVQSDLLSAEEIASLGSLALSRSVPWAVATRNASSEEETSVLSLGAVEYLPMTEKSEVAQARLERIMQDRFSVQRDQEIQRIDQLTELPNRSALLDRLQGASDNLNQGNGSLALIGINIKGFKSYNKSHGYLSGDKCLSHLAKLFSAMFNETEVYLVRFSGNEFAVLLKDVEEPRVQELVENIRQTVKAAKIKNRTSPNGFLSVKVGYHILHAEDKSTTYELVDETFQRMK